MYGFAKHKGYGTAAHIAAIKEYGLCPLHRRSFVKNIIWIQKKDDKQRNTEQAEILGIKGMKYPKAEDLKNY